MEGILESGEGSESQFKIGYFQNEIILLIPAN